MAIEPFNLVHCLSSAIVLAEKAQNMHVHANVGVLIRVD